ncbi:hypothetical protein M514_11158, partial [Trichuris suis]
VARSSKPPPVVALLWNHGNAPFDFNANCPRLQWQSDERFEKCAFFGIAPLRRRLLPSFELRQCRRRANV